MSIFDEIYKVGIVPVVVIDDVSVVSKLGELLMTNGLPCAEVTFRTEQAEETIKILSKEYPDMLVGAGTVLTPEQAERAINAGARFIVSPGLNPDVVRFCQSKNMPIIPGIMTPTELELALSLGLDTVKFFPAQEAGGLKMIKAMSAPYQNMRFMPTGGINPENVEEYLALPKILACGGSWMVKKDDLKSKNFEALAAKIKGAADIAKKYRA